jgi:plasmid stabilization system protein ParE
MAGRASPAAHSTRAVTGRSVRIHPAAFEEAEAASLWYRQRSQRAAEMFLDELDRAIERISNHPEQFSVNEFGTRRILLRRFPYVVVFRDIEAFVEILQWLMFAADPVTGEIGVNKNSTRPHQCFLNFGGSKSIENPS